MFALALTLAFAAPVDITIIGTSDLHGRLGQLPLLGGYLENLRAARPDSVVLLDGGDVFQGTLESALDEGEAAIRAYGVLGYHAVAIGNHEFDFGPVGPESVATDKDNPRGALLARTKQARFPFLAANLRENGAPLKWPNVRPSVLIKLKNGVRVGVIGATTMATPETTVSANFARLSVTPLLETITTEAKKLRASGAHIVVLTAHAGGRCEKFEASKDLSSCDPKQEIFQLAEQLPRGSVDAIVGGHVHAGIAHEVNGIPIIEAFAQGQSFGRIDLVYDPAKKKVTAQFIHAPMRLKTGATYEGRAVVESAAVQAVVAPAIAAAESRRKTKLGAELEDTFERSYGAESTLGNWLTSMMLALEPRAKIALTNGGGLRADLPSGPLEYGALYNALPFDNRLALVSMKGRALKALFTHNLGASSGVLSIAGASVDAACKANTLDVALKWTNGRPISDDEDILVVTNDFLATGGEGFAGGEIVDKGPVIREALAEQIMKSAASLHAADWYEKQHPRLHLPSARPIACAAQ